MFFEILGKLSLHLALIMEVIVFPGKSVNTTKNTTSQLLTSFHTLIYSGEIMCTEFENSFYMDVFNNSESCLMGRYAHTVQASREGHPSSCTFGTRSDSRGEETSEWH